MSSYTFSSAKQIDTNNQDNRLEIFCLIWLDANPKETRDTEQKLRSIINRLIKFQDVKTCQKWIEAQSQNDRLIMIVSGTLGREIVPSIYKLRQVVSIFVYCMNREHNLPWASQYSKIKAVVVELDELVARLHDDHKIQKVVEEPLAISFAGNSTAGVDGQFVFNQVLIDCLLRLQSNDQDRKELIHLCKKQYEGNNVELEIIREFKKNYSRNKAIWWYTREAFFYKILNGALRAQEIHVIFLFRAFISDIRQQLMDNAAKHPLRVYRSQLISTEELKRLIQSRGQLISINSFLSTSFNRQKALSFLSSSYHRKDLEPILFEIQADSKRVKSKPFADITRHSYFQEEEEEVLFMLGSIFRLNDVSRSSDNQVTIITMTLYTEDEHDLKDVLKYMKLELGHGETNLHILGKFLCKMGSFNLAELYFERLLKQLPPNDPLATTLYQDLADVTSQARKFDQSMKWHQKLLSSTSPDQQTPIIHINKKRFSRVIPNLPVNATWETKGVTVAGGHDPGTNNNQLYWPRGFFVDDDDDQTIVIADWFNDRIMKWKRGDTQGQVAAGGNGQGNRLAQFDRPTDVLLDKETNSLIIADCRNRRVVRWSRRSGTRQGEILIENINCWGLAMDEQRNLYVSDWREHEIRRYEIDRGDKTGTVVAGGNEAGSGLNQFGWPTYLFVDRNQSLYVSDQHNHRVMKWDKGAAQGAVVAGGQEDENALAQLSYPNGIFVDTLGTVYVAEGADDFGIGNHRVTRWLRGSEKKGTVVVGGNGEGSAANQFNSPRGLSFDRHGNLYVVDNGNHRVQRFNIIK